MAFYEHVFIARQDLSSKQTEELASSFEKILKDGKAKVERTEHWGLRTLAYRINKNRKGHYVLFHIDGDNDAVKEMERNMSLSEDILRFMTIRMDEMPKDGTVMAKDSRAA